MKLYEFDISNADDRNKIYQRKIDCERVAKELRAAAEKAQSNGDIDLADKMKKRAEQLEKLAKEFNGLERDEEEEEVGGSRNGKNPAKNPEQQDLIKAFIESVKKAGGKAISGAIKALSEMSKSMPVTSDSTKAESLHEAADEDNLNKSLRDFSSDEFSKLIDSSLDLIDKVSPKAINRTSKDQMTAKMQEIEAENNNPLANRALSAEEAKIMRKNIQATKARESELDKYSSSSSFGKFKINFYNTIRDQVEQVRQEYQDYSEINAEYEDEDIIMKADVIKELPDEALPSIDIYIDRSGSWCDPKQLQIQKEMIEVLKDFHERGEIKLNVFYFKNGQIFSTSVAAGGDTLCWSAILKNIIATKTKNVVIMTDADMFGQGIHNNTTVRVPGVVWWLWWNDTFDRYKYEQRHGSAKDIALQKQLAEILPQRLSGRSGNHQYVVG